MLLKLKKKMQNKSNNELCREQGWWRRQQQQSTNQKHPTLARESKSSIKERKCTRCVCVCLACFCFCFSGAAAAAAAGLLLFYRHRRMNHILLTQSERLSVESNFWACFFFEWIACARSNENMCTLRTWTCVLVAFGVSIIYTSVCVCVCASYTRRSFRKPITTTYIIFYIYFDAIFSVSALFCFRFLLFVCVYALIGLLALFIFSWLK